MNKTQLHEQVLNSFKAQPPRSDEVRHAFDTVALQFENLAHTMIDLLPEGRSLELVIEQLTSTKREAIAAIACSQDEFIARLGEHEA
jgi:hypothetical protein